MRVLGVGDLPPGTLRRFTAGGVEGFLVNRGGGISAISARCTHMGCALAADDGRGSSKSASFTAPTSGTISFKCRYHPG